MKEQQKGKLDEARQLYCEILQSDIIHRVRVYWLGFRMINMRAKIREINIETVCICALLIYVNRCRCTVHVVLSTIYMYMCTCTFVNLYGIIKITHVLVECSILLLECLHIHEHIAFRMYR